MVQCSRYNASMRHTRENRWVSKCVFCQIVTGDSPASVIYEDELVLGFLDIAPLSKGHSLVIPKQHHTSITTLPEPYSARLMAVAAQLGAALARVVDGDGFNLLLSNGACAGQIVPHVHLHVIPRHPTDGIVLPMRTVAYRDEAEKAEVIENVKLRLTQRLQ